MASTDQSGVYEGVVPPSIAYGKCFLDVGYLSFDTSDDADEYPEERSPKLAKLFLKPNVSGAVVGPNSKIYSIDQTVLYSNDGHFEFWAIDGNHSSLSVQGWNWTAQLTVDGKNIGTFTFSPDSSSDASHNLGSDFPIAKATTGINVLQGPGFTSAEIDDSGHLLITQTSGGLIDGGYIGASPTQITKAVEDSANAITMASSALNDVDQKISDAIASDASIVEAATNAVDAALDTEVDAKGLVGGFSDIPIDPTNDPVVFSIADSQNRRSWIEISNDGGPSEHTKRVLADELTTPVSGSDASGVVYTVTDSSGRMSELTLDNRGRFPDWVLAAWASRLNLQQTDPVSVKLPSQMYAVQGQTHKLIHNHYISALSQDQKVKALANLTDGGGSFAGFWQITPTVNEADPLTITVYDRSLKQLTQKATSVIVNDTAIKTQCRLLPIGDSITRTGLYAKNAAQVFATGDSYGSRVVSGVATEGRGGWTLNDYMTRIGMNDSKSVDSPFLFPVGIPANAYWGNTSSWAAIVAAGGDVAYGTAGFQQMARAGFASSGAFLFGADGYPVTPASGDVVVDPLKPVGSRWQQYDGAAWQPMNPQPATQLNFSSYMTRYSAAFTSGSPTMISIMLGTNDFYAGITQATFDVFSGQMDSLISSIRTWSPSIPIAVCIPPVGGFQDNWSTAGEHLFEYVSYMHTFASMMAVKYDTITSRSNGVYLTSFLGAVQDSHFGINNTVHPDADGHAEMAPWLAGTIAYALN